MKVIFSRKGWDSSAGGKPSPIFSGGGFSLPIPDNPPNGIAYSKLNPSALPCPPYGNLAAFLSKYAKNLRSTQPAHLDPDIDRSIYPRGTGWTPCFGQENGAAGHLNNQGIKIGDLFIFYGWFDDVSLTTLHRSHVDRFCVFGYLQIGQIFHNPSPATTPSWLHYHPHISNGSAYRNNRIYVASPSLSFPNESGISLPKHSGGGILNPAATNRCLTKTAGKRGMYPDKLISVCSSMTRHRQEHVWQPNSPNDWGFVASLLK
jgi:hypothetical protein